ncbi:MAG TPA: gliding motility protein GldL, partial [Bacteroidia bacterium]|nr:gliding motility protein GldL [Bacteroidia bacterium]
MSGKNSLFASRKWKAFMAKLYGFGAAVVIVGALFKIQHWTGASAMLIVGLGTEAVIFAFSAFEPIHEDLDWTLVYPELAGMPEEEKAKELEQAGDDTSLTQ